MDALARCEAEIADLHAFFESWFRGERADTDEAFARLPAALDEDFVMITPDGDRRSRDVVCRFVREAHGSHADAGFAIDVADVRVRADLGDHWLCTYEEHQRLGEETTVRASSVLFGADEEAPNGVAWRHLQETWRDPDGDE